MQQIADRVRNVHVTTVSRAVDDKWSADPPRHPTP